MAENKLQTLSPLLNPQVIKTQASFFSGPQLSCQIFHKETSTTHFIFHRTHQSLSECQNYMHHFEMPTQTNNNTYFGAYLHSAGTQHGNLHLMSAATSRVTYFILPAHTGTGVRRGGGVNHANL